MTRGFTLIEIVVTLTIAAAVAVPALASMLDREPDPSANVVELLDRARRTAAERGTRVTVVLNPKTARYWVWADTDEGRATLSEGVLALAAGAHFEPTKDRAVIAFDSYGAASGDTLVVRTAGGTELVAAERWTGEVHVTRP